MYLTVYGAIVENNEEPVFVKKADLLQTLIKVSINQDKRIKQLELEVEYFKTRLNYLINKESDYD